LENSDQARTGGYFEEERRYHDYYSRFTRRR
jgi:hypothetical protein